MQWIYDRWLERQREQTPNMPHNQFIHLKKSRNNMKIILLLFVLCICEHRIHLDPISIQIFCCFCFVGRCNLSLSLSPSFTLRDLMRWADRNYRKWIVNFEFGICGHPSIWRCHWYIEPSELATWRSNCLWCTWPYANYCASCAGI